MEISQLNPISAALYGLSCIAIGFLSKFFIDRLKKDSEKIDQAIEALRNEMHQNTLALTELKVELKHITSALKVIPELEKDLNALGRIVREKLNN